MSVGLPRIWFWMGEGKSKGLKEYLKENLIVIDTGISKDLSGVSSAEDLQKSLPGDHKKKHVKYFNFIKKMEINDYVFAVIQKGKPPLGKLGKIVGQCEYTGKGGIYARKVEWLINGPISLADLGIKRKQPRLLTLVVRGPDDIDLPTWQKVLNNQGATTVLPSGNTFQVPEVVRQIWDLLRSFKRQVILYGPPGTSKTFYALAVVAYALGCQRERLDDYRLFRDGSLHGKLPKGGWELIQFHSEFGYEDFVVGIVPRVAQEASILTFEVQPRLFVEIARRARENKEHPYFLVIDEFNRAPLDRTIGELLFAIEYRNEPVYIPLLKDYLIIPDNLYIIGTMNSADKNIGDLDHALRRRFAFYKLQPDRELLKEILQNALGPELTDSFVGQFDELNKIFIELKRPDFAVGHSYFFPAEGSPGPDVVKKHLMFRLELEVEPLLEEYHNEGVLHGEYFEKALKVIQAMKDLLEKSL